MKKFQSVINKRKQFYKDRSRKAVEGRARKRLERPAPQYPVELSNCWADITVRRCINGHMQTETVFLDGISSSSFIAWDPETQENLGAMGLSKAGREIVKRFPRLKVLHD